MHRSVLLLFFTIWSYTCQSQTTFPLHLTIHEGSNWAIKIDTISETGFDGSKAFRYHKNTINKDSLLKAKNLEFPGRIILTDSCCILKGVDKDITICRHLPKNDDKAWTGYDAHDFIHGYLILMEWGYESWSFISFNPATQKYFYSINEPTFIDDETVYSYGNYYAEGQFEIIDIKRNRYFGFETIDWELRRFYRDGTKFYLELVCTRSQKVKRYLRLNYK